VYTSKSLIAGLSRKDSLPGILILDGATGGSTGRTAHEEDKGCRSGGGSTGGVDNRGHTYCKRDGVRRGGTRRESADLVWGFAVASVFWTALESSLHVSFAQEPRR